MNSEKSTTEYLKKLESLKLSGSSRTRIKDELVEYAQFHSVKEGVRVGQTGRSIEQVPSGTSLFLRKYTYMPFAILLAVLVTGGTSFAAQGAVPGDFLYPVKTEVNEPVRSAFAIGANAEAELQAKLVAERIEEAEELEAEGQLEGEAAATLSADIQSHVTKAERAMTNSNAEVRTQTTANLSTSLSRFNSLVQNDTALAITIPATYGTTDTDVSVTTSLLATQEMDIDAFRASAEARVENLVSVVEDSQAELSAEVYASLTAKLEAADELIVESRTQAEADARASLNEASELAGEVESKLSTLGTVEINTQTGAIVDIDFDTVPVLELNADANSTTANESEGEEETETSGEVEVDIEADTSLEINGSDTGVSADGAVRSGVSI